MYIFYVMIASEQLITISLIKSLLLDKKRAVAAMLLQWGEKIRGENSSAHLLHNLYNARNNFIPHGTTS